MEVIIEAFYWEARGILGGPHTWHIACIYLVILIYLDISLEGEFVETLLSILGGVYLFISWSFGMVKALIHPYLLDLFDWRLSTYCFVV